jgi:hypothetical protein
MRGITGLPATPGGLGRWWRQYASEAAVGFSAIPGLAILSEEIAQKHAPEDEGAGQVSFCIALLTSEDNNNDSSSAVPIGTAVLPSGWRSNAAGTAAFSGQTFQSNRRASGLEPETSASKGRTCPAHIERRDSEPRSGAASGHVDRGNSTNRRLVAEMTWGSKGVTRNVSAHNCLTFLVQLAA